MKKEKSTNQKAREIIKELKELADPEAVEGMARYGIRSENTLGIPIPMLRKMAKETGNDHELALLLWNSRIHEARILASMIDEPEKVTEEQMEAWVLDFDSWDVCDQVCMNLFWQTPFAYRKCIEWSERSEEFVKRAAFATMARIAWIDKKRDDDDFVKFLEIIKKEANDNRNFVEKSLSWALRQIGKRNMKLNRLAKKTAREILQMKQPSAKWIALDAMKELESERVKRKLNEKR
ncbi:MAG: DNA alkylation repair protein [Actinomycetota bacterium]|nr:DNA alkylation repair protein [Actinomycetota bacterium]